MPSSKTNQSLFWKIKHPDSEKISYLFGTMHRLPESDRELLKHDLKTYPGFKAAEMLITEVGDHHLMSLAKSQTIDNDLVEEAKKLDKPVYPLERLKDSFKSLYIHKAKLKSPALFYANTQSRFMLHLMGLGSLHALYRNHKKNKTEKAMKALQNDYIKENLITIEETQLKHAYPDLLEKRNLKWLYRGYQGEVDVPTKEPLIKLLMSHSVFIACGYAHLVKETGLIKQLENEGYEVEPIKGWRSTVRIKTIKIG